MAELRPLVAQGRIDLEARGLDDGLVLLDVRRADAVDDRAAGPNPLGGGAKE